MPSDHGPVSGGPPSDAALPARTDSDPRAVTAVLRWLLRLFFHRIEVTGLDNVPDDAGAVLVAWHPNALLDPALVLAHCPGRVIFGARHGLFEVPLLGRLLAYLGTVPIYRPQDFPAGDDEARREANRRSLDALARAVARGSFAMLFPEGVSHDRPHLAGVKPGAARLLLRARELAPPGSPPPELVPVGLHYDRKHLFGSTALVAFHPPIELSDDLAEPVPEPDERRRQVDAVTGAIERTLSDVVQATESWELHYLMHRLRRLVRAERAARAGASPGAATLLERLVGFARVRRGYQELRRERPAVVGSLLERVRAYDAELRALGISDHHLDGGAALRSTGRVALLLGQAVTVYLLLPPLLVLGFVVNAPLAVGLGALARRTGSERKDEATIKLLAGTLIFPLVWLVVSILVAWGQINLHQAYPSIPEAPVWAGIVTFALCSVGGWVAWRYLRLATRTWRSLAIQITRARQRDAIRRLLAERSSIFDATMELARDLELPGRIAPDGRILPSEDDAGEAGAGST